MINYLYYDDFNERVSSTTRSLNFILINSFNLLIKSDQKALDINYLCQADRTDQSSSGLRQN